MKRAWTNFAALGAIGSALATLTCCLPPVLLGAAGFAALATISTRLRPWFLLISAALLLVGLVTAVRGARCGSKPNKWNWFLLSLAALLVILTCLFPQEIAGFAADLFYRGEN